MPSTMHILTLLLQAVYFVKRHAEPVKADTFHSLVMVGDLSHFPLDHFTTVVETVSTLMIMLMVKGSCSVVLDM